VPRERRAPEDGFGLVGMVLSLLIVGVLGAGAVLTLGGGSSSSDLNGLRAGSSASSAGLGADVTHAGDVAAQSTLSTVMQNVLDASVADGGFGGLDLSQYGVVAGPSTSDSAVSGVVSPAGNATLAVLARSGTCWMVWLSSGVTWYGAEVHAASCAAAPVDTAPTAGTTGGVTWQPGSFPSV